MAMTLLELTEPFFQYVCRLNRVARKAGTGASGDTAFLTRNQAAQPGQFKAGLDYAVVRSEIKGLLEEMRQKSNSDVRVAAQFQKIELPLIFFVDSMISESSLGFAGQWNQHRLAYEPRYNELAGDQKFFDLFDETMKESSEDASERLAIYYTCIGLGFTGIYLGQPEYLRKMMLTIAPRIRHLVETDQTAKICPEAYERVDTRDFVRPPSSRVALIAIIFACFTVA